MRSEWEDCGGGRDGGKRGQVHNSPQTHHPSWCLHPPPSKSIRDINEGHIYTPCYKQDTSTLSLCEEVDSALAITSSSYWASCSGMLASTAMQGGEGCTHVHSELVSSFSGVYRAAEGSMHPCTHLDSTQH